MQPYRSKLPWLLQQRAAILADIERAEAAASELERLRKILASVDAEIRGVQDEEVRTKRRGWRGLPLLVGGAVVLAAIAGYGWDFERPAPKSVGPQARIVVLHPAAALAVGPTTTCVRDVEGNASCWGWARVPSPQGIPSRPFDWTHRTLLGHDVHAVGEGASYRCVADGSGASCTPHGAPHETVDLPPEVTSFAMGRDHVCAVLRDGTMTCFGSGKEGQLGTGAHDVESGPVKVPDLSGVKQAAAGLRHTCAVTNAGAVYCWGDGSAGQLGDGQHGEHPKPVHVIDGVAQLAAGDFHTCALMGDGRVECWGANDQGQLGDGTVISRDSPWPVTDAAHAVQIVAQGERTCAVFQAARARCWGRLEHCYRHPNLLTEDCARSVSQEVLPVPLGNDFEGVRELGLGETHLCARFADGHVACSGDNRRGQLGLHLPTFSWNVPGRGEQSFGEERQWSEEARVVSW